MPKPATPARTILVVAADFPYPPNHGGRVDIWQRMRALHAMGYTLDLLTTVSTAPEAAHIAEVRTITRNILTVPRKGVVSALGLRPHQVAGRDNLATVKLEGCYDYLLLEGSYVSPVLANPTLRATHTILRVHNNEPLYFRKLAFSTRHPVRMAYYLAESLRFWLHDSKLDSKLDNFLFISRDEHAAFRQRHPSKHAIFLPPVVPLAKTDTAPTGRNVLFIGSLFMPNNRDGLEWYMRRVHPLLRGIKGYHLVVAGNAKGQSTDWLTAGPYGDEIEFHNSPADLAPLYKAAGIFINPMRFGAGMKIKTVESTARGLPLVTTSTGREGTGLEDGTHIRLADTPQAFAKAVADLLASPPEAAAMSARAQAFLRQEYDIPAKLKAFFKTIG